MKQLADAANEYGDVITSSPAPMPAVMHSRCRPAVPDETAAAYGAPTFAAISSSKRSIVGPSESRPEPQDLDDRLLLPLVQIRPRQRDGARFLWPHLLLHASARVGAYSSHWPQRSLRPCTVSRYACWIANVTAPGGTEWSSTSRIGVTSAAVPTMKTSSAR